MTGENISDAQSEMEHLSLEVLHQSECHVPLELSLKVQFFGLFIQSSHEDQSEGQGVNVVVVGRNSRPPKYSVVSVG